MTIVGIEWNNCCENTKNSGCLEIKVFSTYFCKGGKYPPINIMGSYLYKFFAFGQKLAEMIA